MEVRLDWRKIEQALVEIIRGHHIDIWKDKGESFITIDGEAIRLEDVAKELAERLK